MKYSYSELLDTLGRFGYRRSQELVKPGDYVVRGDVVEIWGTDSMEPVRYNYFGEAVESLEVLRRGSWEKVQGEVTLELTPNRIQTEHGSIYVEDYIVHPVHGIGIFQGIITQPNVEGINTQYIALGYADNDRLLVPLSREAELMPYIGNRRPRLTRLYSQSWTHLKERIQKDLIRVARELLKIYAARQLHTRPVYALASDWVAILAQAVDFTLTEDQERALREIEGDLTGNPEPMDRLLCGDVGFGKTEVALRAAAHIVAQGKQVALVAPTTVLAEQHFALIRERFQDLPVRVARLSRMNQDGQSSVIAALREGTVDFVVGTHRLLGKDVEWHNLGFLIIDEEQKFGVAQKERLKNMRPQVDVLSMSATPIPRTLSMSLSGLRGLSILRTAPVGRLPIKTEVAEYGDSVLKNALIQELERGGQAYVVHNRVQSIEAVVRKVRDLLKGTSYEDTQIGVAHGQLPETALAETMADFMAGKCSILVASSIVEHGLDSPHANTLVVLHSERFGLSDLYQLRGRVGRRSRQAYAHFFLGGIEHEPYHIQNESGEEMLGIHITETAKRRLAALVEADELGSGWSVAMRDLEIRGGGNILGHEQHGNMEAVGLLLYAQLLQEEIGRQAKKLNIPLFQKNEN